MCNKITSVDRLGLDGGKRPKQKSLKVTGKDVVILDKCCSASAIKTETTLDFIGKRTHKKCICSSGLPRGQIQGK